LTETFVLYEILAIRELDTELEIYPLLRARNSTTRPEGASVLRKAWELLRRPDTQAVMHPEARELASRAHYAPFFSLSILWSQIRFLWRRPVSYMRALGTLLWANRGSPNFLLGGILLFPKVVYFADDVQRRGITHLHAHFANHPTAAAWIIHTLTGIPYTFTAHGADFQVDQHMLREKIQHAARVITISEFNREWFVDRFGEACRERVQVIRCGVDGKVFHPRDPSSGDRPQGPFTITCTGTLYEVKGHRYLIEACPQLRQDGFDFVCHLIGDGPLRRPLEELAREVKIHDRIIFRGRLARQDIAEQLRNSQVLVAPSVPTVEGRREGIPVVLMEAMACGVPVVASALSGIPELVRDGETGLLVPPCDGPALCGALRRPVGCWRAGDGDDFGSSRCHCFSARCKQLRFWLFCI
jgi:glycosyltransferase involved in cell wall biosynthesis